MKGPGRLVVDLAGPAVAETKQQPKGSDNVIDYEELKTEVRAWAIEKGWLNTSEPPRPVSRLLMLVVTEVAEGVESVRAGNPNCTRPGMEHLPHVAEELADVVIRLVQMSDEHGFSIGPPINAYSANVHRDPVELHWLIVREAVRLWTNLISPNRYQITAVQELFGVVEFVADQLNIDLAEAVRLKMKFNWTRPHKHGKAC